MSNFTNYYNDLDSDINNMSKWLPAVRNCGIKIPKTKIIKVPEEVAQSFFMERKDDEETIFNWVRSILTNISKLSMNSPFVFMKNGGFSDKFNATNCITKVNAHEITQKMIELNYDALMLGADGITEMVFREYIPYDKSATRAIYNGLAFRTEYRVFYDFEKHRVLYSANYWDWDYCHDAICRNANDKLVYESTYNKILDEYVKNENDVKNLVSEAMKNVSELRGMWSVDVMQDENNNFWLIDMAIAQQSAYWDGSKIESEEK